jgi:stress response protein YsnF
MTYYERSIQTVRDVITSYIETQKETLRSFQDSLEPAINNTIDRVRNNYRNYYSSPYSSSYPWMYPRHIADTYGMIVNALADNTMATLRLTNNTIFANLQAFKISMVQIGENAKEISKISIDTAKTVQRASRVAAHGEE